MILISGRPAPPSIYAVVKTARAVLERPLTLNQSRLFSTQDDMPPVPSLLGWQQVTEGLVEAGDIVQDSNPEFDPEFYWATLLVGAKVHTLYTHVVIWRLPK